MAVALRSLKPREALAKKSGLANWTQPTSLNRSSRNISTHATCPIRIAYSHQRRDAIEQFFAVANFLCRIACHPDILAGFSKTAVLCRPGRLYQPPQTVWRAVGSCLRNLRGRQPAGPFDFLMSADPLPPSKAKIFLRRLTSSVILWTIVLTGLFSSNRLLSDGLFLGIIVLLALAGLS